MRPWTLLDVLLGVARLLDSEEAYAMRSGTDATDDQNQPCGYTTDRAAKFTILGACKRSARDLGVGMRAADQKWYWDALHAIDQHLPQVPLFTAEGALIWFTEPRSITHEMAKEAVWLAIADQPAEAWRIESMVAS